MKQSLEQTKANLITMAALAVAALGMVACGGGSAAQAAEHKEEEPAPVVQYGSLDQTGSTEVVPRHLSPRPGATLNEVMPTFVWTGFAGASGFEVEVSEDTRFPDSKTISSGVVKGPPWTSREELDAGKAYYWRIRAVYQSSSRGPWSDYSPFSIAAVSVPVSGTADGVTVAHGERGAVVANLSVWDAGSQVLISTPGRSLEDVLKALEPGRVYQFAASLDMLIKPQDFGIDRPAIQLTGGRQQLVFW